MKIFSHDEYSTLKSMVVGDATHANWPVNDPVFSSEAERTLWKEHLCLLDLCRNGS